MTGYGAAAAKVVKQLEAWVNTNRDRLLALKSPQTAATTNSALPSNVPSASAPSPQRPDPVKSESPASVPGTPEPSLATIHITSDPAGAEIELDGQYFGNTPSDVKLKPGPHALKVTKKGFRPWHRYFTAESGDSRNMVAELENASQ